MRIFTSIIASTLFAVCAAIPVSVESFCQEADTSTVYELIGQAFDFKEAGNYLEALKYLNLAIQRSPGSSYIYNCKGLLFLDAERYEEALDNFTRAVDLDTTAYVCYYNKGRTYRYLDRPSDAIEYYNAALELNGAFYSCVLSRGVAHYFNRQYDRALDDFKRALELNPLNEQPYYELGNVYANMNQIEGAPYDLPQSVHYYRKCISLGIRNLNFEWVVNSFRDLLNLYTEGDLGDVDLEDFFSYYSLILDGIQMMSDESIEESAFEAVRKFEEASRIYPANSDAYFLIGTIYSIALEYDSAVSYYRKALEKEPESPILNFQTGVMLQNSGRNAEAVQYYDRAIERHATYYDALVCRGVVHCAAGDFVKALADFERAIELNPDDPQPYINCGDMYADLQDMDGENIDYDMALHFFTEALKLSVKSMDFDTFKEVENRLLLMKERGIRVRQIEELLGIPEKDRVIKEM
jgi:tetratricopeptide (TPR) repeat protein